MNPFSEIDDDFARFFRQRGVTVTWDFDRSTGLHWYELGDERGLICQVDFGVPLEEFLADLPHFVEEREGVGPTSYTCCCPPENTERLRALCERVSCR